MIEYDDLKCCRIFTELNDRELEEVAKLGTVEKRGAGSRVVTEGSDAAAVYLIKKGKVSVRMKSRDGHEVMVDELGPGDLVGWSAVLGHKAFRADVWTVEDSELIVVDGAGLQKLFEQNNHIGYRAVRIIAEVVASRLENLRAKLVDQPFSPKYLAPLRASSTTTAGAKSEMRSMSCPECTTSNRPFAIMNDTEQYRCRNCGMIYYSPAGCETESVIPSSSRGDPTVQLGDNWAAANPMGGK
jgi:CRP/FNR family cyclic AMP-dependent transcriptional regulator